MHRNKLRSIRLPVGALLEKRTERMTDNLHRCLRQRHTS